MYAHIYNCAASGRGSNSPLTAAPRVPPLSSGVEQHCWALFIWPGAWSTAEPALKASPPKDTLAFLFQFSTSLSIRTPLECVPTQGLHPLNTFASIHFPTRSSIHLSFSNVYSFLDYKVEKWKIDKMERKKNRSFIQRHTSITISVSFLQFIWPPSKCLSNWGHFGGYSEGHYFSAQK